MAAGFAMNTNEVFTTELILPMNVHVTIMAVNPDGTVSYSQGDNVIFGTGKDLAASALYNPTGTRADAFVCVGLGEDATPNEADKGLTSPLGTTLVACSVVPPNANLAGTDGTGAGLGNKVDVVVATIIAAGEGTTSITEVALSNGGQGNLASAAGFTNGVISHIDLAANVDVVEGTEITVTYTMETG